MPMVSDLYPLEWKEFAKEVKAANFYICQECGLECRRPGEPFDTHRRTMSVAHYDSDYTSAEIFVVAMCSGCHNRLDGPYRLANRRRKLRLRQQRAGQMAFSPHLRENAPGGHPTAEDIAELESLWPGHEYLLSLEDGVDRFMEYGVTGGSDVATCPPTHHEAA